MPPTEDPACRQSALGITEVATALAALDLLFLFFVIVQFRYLFGGDALVQVTPDLTYQYARRGFFELVFASALVVPVLLAADWLLDRRTPRDAFVFRGLAGMQIALVLAIAASALQRLRLYPRELRAHRVTVLRDGAADLDRRDAVVAGGDRAARPP